MTDNSSWVNDWSVTHYFDGYYGLNGCQDRKEELSSANSTIIGGQLQCWTITWIDDWGVSHQTDRFSGFSTLKKISGYDEYLQSPGWQPFLLATWCLFWWFVSLEKNMAIHCTMSLLRPGVTTQHRIQERRGRGEMPSAKSTDNDGQLQTIYHLKGWLKCAPVHLMGFMGWIWVVQSKICFQRQLMCGFIHHLR